MNTPTVDWLLRGREHMAKGSLADAIVYFEKAVKTSQSVAQAYFHLGESWWGLGRVDRAYAAWAAGNQQDVDYLPCLQAKTEALLHLGDLQGAAQEAQAVLLRLENEPRAQTLCALAALERGDVTVLPTLSTLAKTHEDIFKDIAFARALAHVFDAAKTDQQTSAIWQMFMGSLYALERPLPAVLAVALLTFSLRKEFNNIEPAAAIFEAVSSQALAAQDADAWRRLALALFSMNMIERADFFMRRYAEMQSVAHAEKKQRLNVMPLNWPQRSAGGLRIGCLLPPVAETNKNGLLQRWRDIIEALHAATSEVTLWVSDEESALFWRDAPGDQGAGVFWQVRVLPEQSPGEVLAMFDYDVLVDGAGFSWPCATFSLERPARTLWRLTDKTQAGCLREWWNQIFVVEDIDPRQLSESLATEQRLLPASSSLSAQAFFERRDKALKAHQQGTLDQAKEVYSELLEAQPAMATLHYLAAMLAQEMQDEGAATVHFEAALRAAPDYAKPYQAFGEFLLEHDPSRAKSVVDEGLQRLPLALDLYRLTGEIAIRQGDSQEAEHILKTVLASAPADPKAHFNLGVVLHQQGRAQEAARSYQRALVFEPEMLEGHFNLGAIFHEQKQLGAARQAYRYVLSKQARHVRAYAQLGEVLAEAGELREWFENFKTFQEHCPTSITMASQGLEACQFMGDHKRIEFFIDGLRDFAFRAESNAELIDALDLLQYQLLFLDVEPELSLNMARLYDEAMRKTFGEPLPRPERRRSGKLRIGYLSADLRDHVMGRMVWQAAKSHDKEKFEIFFYSLDTRQDSVTEKFKVLADHFHTLPGLGEREIAKRIAQDDLDILVDLSTNTKGSKPGVLALKPARVQITHIASAGTLGLSTIDFKLTDHFADVEEMQPFQIEQFLPMQGCVYPYQHIEPTLPHPYHRKALGIADDAVLIGAFVVPTKLSARCLALWKKVLDRIPKAKLVFSPLLPAYVQIYRHLMNSVGITEDRYLFLPIPTNSAMRQSRYAIIDFVLDPMPFGNVNGALEPLDAGVPIVTLLGRRHGERSTYSILQNLGETRTVAKSGNDYIEIAMRLATDKDFMKDVRASIQKGLKDSPLVDMVQHCRNLEAAYLQALALKAPEVLAEVGAV